MTKLVATEIAALTHHVAGRSRAASTVIGPIPCRGSFLPDAPDQDAQRALTPFRSDQHKQTTLITGTIRSPTGTA